MLPTRKYMNQKPVEPGKLRKDTKLPVSPFYKLDGIHVIVAIHSDWSVDVVSRTNEPLPSLQAVVAGHIEDGHLDKDMVYFCEAWSPSLPFPEISGAVRRKKELVPDSIDLYPFDCVTMPEWHAELSPRSWIDRVNLLRLRYPTHLLRGLTMIPTHVLYEPQELARCVAVKQDSPGPIDGVILRDVFAGWTPGPATLGAVVKIKPRPTYDLEVIGYMEGKGKYQGMIGALVVRTGEETVCEVGTGLTDDMRRQAGADYVGLIAEVSTLGVNKSGKLREPAFLRWRLDKKVGEWPAKEDE